jgi:hypothetical protein
MVIVCDSRKQWRRVRGDGVGPKVVLGNLCQGLAHLFVVRREVINRLFDGGDEALLAVSSHLRVHTVALASVIGGAKEVRIMHRYGSSRTKVLTLTYRRPSSCFWVSCF